jgi:purine-binding chemotaxis protein CheW
MKNKDIKSMSIHPQSQLKKATQAEGKIVQLIVFELGGEEYGADINQVREIIRTGTITAIPDSPDFIKGVSNVRGEVPVIIDLKSRFFLPPVKRDIENKHIVITEQDKNVFGLLVDEVTEVLRIPESQIKSTPGVVTRMDREYVSGVITLENRIVILLDLSKVLSEEELAKLNGIVQKQSRRYDYNRPRARGKQLLAETTGETSDESEDQTEKIEMPQLT